jgi:hypothetical protein
MRLPDGRDRAWLRLVLRFSGAVLLVAVGTFSVSRASLSATPALKGPGLAILYTSSWDGSPEIFAADPAGKRPVEQVTFASGPGATDPLPSPDGRKLLFRYCDKSCGVSSALWLAAADGSGARIITSDCCAWAVAWSPDSRRFAYLCCASFSATSWRLHVVSADGSTDRVVNSSSNWGTIVWSPDGRHVHVASSTEATPTPSPNGRWEAYFYDGSTPTMPTANLDNARIEVDDAKGSRVASLNGAWWPAWSPNSRLLAYATKNGISVLDPHTGTSRLLSHDIGSQLAWSPGGHLLAYVQGAQYATPGGLRTVTLDGHVHVVAAENGPYGGPIFAYAWTRVPNDVSYRAPSPVSGLFTGWRVTALTADGGRVAYATCDGVFTWDATAAQAIQVVPTPYSNNCIGTTDWEVPRIALAGDRLAYITAQGGSTTFWSAVGVSLATTAQPIVLASGSNTSGPPIPEVAGSGGLLALATRDTGSSNLLWHIQTVGPSGCPCQEILRFQQPLLSDRYTHLDDVDSGRLVVNGGGLVRILGTDGTPLLTLSVETANAALSGDDFVVQSDNGLQDYSAATGTLLHTWPLAASTQLCAHCAGSALQDVARGLAAYTVDGQLHLVRLSDGSDTIIGPADLARFADTGLVLAVGSRIQLIPYDELPLH